MATTRHSGVHDFDSLGAGYDPRVSGYAAAIGERGIMTDGTVLFKNGTADTAWIDASTVLLPPTPTTNPLLAFGALNTNSGSYTAYLLSSNRTGTLPPTTDNLNTRYVMTRAGTLQRLFVAQTAPPGAAVSVTYTVRLNGVDTPIVVAISGASASTGSDIAHTKVFVAGDYVSIKIVGTASSSAPGITTTGLEYA